jgi:hypothetical protein
VINKILKKYTLFNAKFELEITFSNLGFALLRATIKSFSGGKGKVIPLHVMEALGVRGGIAPTHS